MTLMRSQSNSNSSLNVLLPPPTVKFRITDEDDQEAEEDRGSNRMLGDHFLSEEEKKEREKYLQVTM